MRPAAHQPTLSVLHEEHSLLNADTLETMYAWCLYKKDYVSFCSRFP